MKDLKLKHGQYRLFAVVIMRVDLVKLLIYFTVIPFLMLLHIYLFFLYWGLTYMKEEVQLAPMQAFF
jgi:hypothetical protein